MTTVVGLVHTDGTVWLGGDSAASGNDTVLVRRDPKLFYNGPFLMGFCQSFRARDIIQYSTSLPVPGAGEDIDRFMRTAFVDAMRQAFNKAGNMKTNNGSDVTQARFLVGFAGRLFMVDFDLQVGELHQPFHAIGSGAPEAMGSLYSTRGWEDPHARIVEALEASAFYNGTVRPPFTVAKTQFARSGQDIGNKAA